MGSLRMDEGWVTMDDQLASSASSLREDSDDGGLQARQEDSAFSQGFDHRLITGVMRHLHSLSPGQNNDGEDCDDEDEEVEEEDDCDSATRQSIDESASTIAEIFRCFICLGNVVDAHMCPSCSKICCLACIKRWLTDQRPQCPHCRASLCVSQLVNCRFIADIQGELEKIQGKVDARSSEKPCNVHDNQPLTYYCKTCSRCVCSDCAVFDETHRGHSFEKLSATYERHVDVIRAEAAGIRQRLKELWALVAAVDKNIKTVHKAKDDCSAELQVAVEDMQNRLEQQLKQKLLALLAQKGGMTQEVEVLDAMLHKLNKELNTSTQGELIARSEGIRRMLKDIHRRPTSDFARAPVSAEFVSEIVPPYDQGEFFLKDYEKKMRKLAIAAAALSSSRNEGSGDSGCTGGEVVYSEPINAGGVVWRLKVYPNGNGNARGMYLSVFLEMVQGGQEPAKYEYRVEMVHRHQSHQCIVREFASPFEVGECWGYNRFFRIDCLEKDGYLFPNEDDTIHLRFYVRTPTYGQQCMDLRRALALARQEKVEAEAQIAMLQRAFADTLWWNRRRRYSRSSLSTSSRLLPARHAVSHSRPQVSGGGRRSGARQSREGRDVESDSAIAPLRSKLLENKELLQSVMGPSHATNRLLPNAGSPSSSKPFCAASARNLWKSDSEHRTSDCRKHGETDENVLDTSADASARSSRPCLQSIGWLEVEGHGSNQAVDEEQSTRGDYDDEDDEVDDELPRCHSAPGSGEPAVFLAGASGNECMSVSFQEDMERVVLEVPGNEADGASSSDGCVIVQMEAVGGLEVGVTEVTGTLEVDKALGAGGERGKPIRVDSLGSSSGWSDNTAVTEVMEFDLESEVGSECEGFSLESSLGGGADKDSLHDRDSDVDSLLSYNICRLSPISEPNGPLHSSSHITPSFYASSHAATSPSQLLSQGWGSLRSGTRSGPQASDVNTAAPFGSGKYSLPTFERFVSGCSSSLLHSCRPSGLEYSLAPSSSLGRQGKGLLSLSGAASRPGSLGPIGPRRCEDGLGGASGAVGAVREASPLSACTNQIAAPSRGQLQTDMAETDCEVVKSLKLQLSKPNLGDGSAEQQKTHLEWSFPEPIAADGRPSVPIQSTGSSTKENTVTQLMSCDRSMDFASKGVNNPQVDPWCMEDNQGTNHGGLMGPSPHEALAPPTRPPPQTSADNYWIRPLYLHRPIERGILSRIFDSDDGDEPSLQKNREAAIVQPPIACPEPEQDTQCQMLPGPSSNKCTPMLETTPWSGEHWWHRELLRMMELPLSESASGTSERGNEGGEASPLLSEDRAILQHASVQDNGCAKDDDAVPTDIPSFESLRYACNVAPMSESRSSEGDCDAQEIAFLHGSVRSEVALDRETEGTQLPISNTLPCNNVGPATSLDAPEDKHVRVTDLEICNELKWFEHDSDVC